MTSGDGSTEPVLTDEQLAQELRAAQVVSVESAAATELVRQRRRAVFATAAARHWSQTRIARESGADRATVRAVLAAAEKPPKEQPS